MWKVCVAYCERTLRISCPVIVVYVHLAYVDVGRIVAGGRVVHDVTVMVSGHICMDICVVMPDVDGGRMPVAGRVVSPVPGRTPGSVSVCPEVGENEGCCIIDGLDIVARTVYVRITYNLYVCACRTGYFGHESGNILINVHSQYGLDYENVVVSIYRFKYAEIIDVSVSVKVEVREHI